MPDFLSTGLFGVGGIDHKAQSEHYEKHLREQASRQATKREIVRQTELATGKVHVSIDGRDVYMTKRQYDKLLTEEE